MRLSRDMSMTYEHSEVSNGDLLLTKRQHGARERAGPYSVSLMLGNTNITLSLTQLKVIKTSVSAVHSAQPAVRTR